MEGSGTSTLATGIHNTQNCPTENARPEQNRRHPHRRRDNDHASEWFSISTPNGQQKRRGHTNPSDQLLREGDDLSGSAPSQQAKADILGHPSPSQGRGNRRRGKPASKPDSETRNESLGGTSSQPPSIKDGSRRRANFGSSLTKPDESDPAKPIGEAQKRKARGRQRLPQGDDLTSTLTRELSTPPYPDCFICFSPIRPEHAIWSCSPSSPIYVSNEAQVREYCWTSFHIKCIRSWAGKSVKEVADAWRARGESDKKGDWRCPGCQAKREVVPSGYWCFCHSTAEPKPTRLSTPHSCGASCSRPRESACGHPCPLQCHPGPCPSCQIMTRQTCYCPRKQIFTHHCGADGRGKGKGVRDLSCGNVCGQPLDCGKHACQKTCHDGVCDPCEVLDQARCWCGKEEKQVRCGVGEEVQCFVESQMPWAGRFACDNTCERLFDCGKHKCDKPCHPHPFKPEVCPRSPSNVTHCPCGRHTIAPTPSSAAPQYTFAARLDCSDPIPTCESVCSKPHLACEHSCTSKCHDGPCPPCDVQIVRPCRCGTTTKSLPCHIVHSNSTLEEKESLCDKPCHALRACGRHQCRRICCPLASLAIGIGRKGKRRAVPDEALSIGEERGGLHECDLVCGKLLSCGNHKCEQKDHKGLCPPCLRSSFEELVCACGRTVYEPPIPCGTSMECDYPCPRPRTTCDHQNTSHSCHDDSIRCPPCPHLTDKLCACGKKVVSNIRCSLETEKVSCGTVCGRLMLCGFHHCERMCHSDPCGECLAPCGKSRKSCLPNIHPCARPCHAPSSCSETEPCQSLVTLTCPCGRIKQSVTCGRTASSGSATRSNHPTLKCTNDCLISKRNARLADALGISTEVREKGHPNVVYNDELANFARANGRFLVVVEKAFADFLNSEKRTQVLPHMPPDRRKFVHDIAAVYRMDTQMVDQEPHRSVQLLRRSDTRTPSPLLSTYIASTAPPPSLGKLADLRAVRGPAASAATPSSGVLASLTSSAGSWRVSGSGRGSTGLLTSRPIAPVGQRGWASTIAKQAGPITGGLPTAVTTVDQPLPRSLTPLIGSSGTASRTASPVLLPAENAPRENIPDCWEEDDV